MQLNSYQGFFFDYDYTLANSEKAILKCFYATFNHCKIEAPSETDIKATIGLPLIEAFAVLTGCNEASYLEELTTVYKSYAKNWMVKLTTLYPETKALIEGLKASGKIVGIISNKMAKTIQATLDNEGIEVDLILGSDVLSELKPHPLGLKQALEKFSLNPQEVVYCGDHLVDAQFAQNAGTAFIPVLTGNNTPEDFAPYPHLMVLDKAGQILNYLTKN